MGNALQLLHTGSQGREKKAQQHRVCSHFRPRVLWPLQPAILIGYNHVNVVESESLLLYPSNGR